MNFAPLLSDHLIVILLLKHTNQNECSLAVEAVGLEPTHTRHQILSLARLPVTTRPELKHPNDFRSHICRVPDGFNSPSPYEPKTLINILTPWIYPIL